MPGVVQPTMLFKTPKKVLREKPVKKYGLFFLDRRTGLPELLPVGDLEDTMPE